MAAADGTAAAAAERMTARAARLRDLSPPLRVVAADWDKATSDAFRAQRSPAGEKWSRLKLSTIQHRAAKLKGGNRRSKKSGKLTKGARRVRETAVASYASGFNATDFAPLIDTGQLRNGTRYRPESDRIVIETLAHGLPHIDGAENLDKRNYLVVDHGPGGDGDLRVVEPRAKDIPNAVTRYVETGKA